MGWVIALLLVIIYSQIANHETMRKSFTEVRTDLDNIKGLLVSVNHSVSGLADEMENVICAINDVVKEIEGSAAFHDKVLFELTDIAAHLSSIKNSSNAIKEQMEPPVERTYIPFLDVPR